MFALNQVAATHRPIAKPSDGETALAYYNAHNEEHCIRFQGTTIPCGFLEVHDAVNGSKGDDDLLRASGLEPMLEEMGGDQLTCLCVGDTTHATDPDRQGLAFPGFPTVIQYRDKDGNELGPDTVYDYDHDMAWASLREENEHAFAQITRLWEGLDVPKRLMRSGYRKVGRAVHVAVSLTNLITAYQGGNKVTERFGCSPMTVDDIFECTQRNRERHAQYPATSRALASLEDA